MLITCGNPDLEIVFRLNFICRLEKKCFRYFYYGAYGQHEFMISAARSIYTNPSPFHMNAHLRTSKNYCVKTSNYTKSTKGIGVYIGTVHV